MKNKKRRGFTLVELLVVLLILGVLVGLAVPRYMEAQKNARFRTFSANVREIQSTMEVYRMDKTSTGPAKYPDNLSELTSYFTQPPINPYTGKSMLSDNPEESGLQYTNNGSTYTLTVVQRDVDDVNKNGDTTEPLPVALNVVTDTEPPVILAVTLTGTVDGEYGTYDITPFVYDYPYPIVDPIVEDVRTVTVSVNDITGMILSITVTDNVGVTSMRIDFPYLFDDSVQLTPSVTPGTWQYTFDSHVIDYLGGAGTSRCLITLADAAGHESKFSFYFEVTE